MKPIRFMPSIASASPANGSGALWPRRRNGSVRSVISARITLISWNVTSLSALATSGTGAAKRAGSRNLAGV